MSKNEKSKYFSEKTRQLAPCDHNALIFDFSLKNFVTIIFIYFPKKQFKHILFSHSIDNGNMRKYAF